MSETGMNVISAPLRVLPWLLVTPRHKVPNRFRREAEHRGASTVSCPIVPTPQSIRRPELRRARSRTTFANSWMGCPTSINEFFGCA
jgi:hypothetical protein